MSKQRNVQLEQENMSSTVIQLEVAVGCPVLDKGTSIIPFTAAATATAAAAEMLPNADGYLSNCVETPRQYNQAEPTNWIRQTRQNTNIRICLTSKKFSYQDMFDK